MAKDTSKNAHYISREESKRIERENREAYRRYALKKKMKVCEADYTTQMKDSSSLVEFDDLHTYFYTDAGTVRAVNGVTFSVPEGSTVGIVGESGCGKSVTSLSLMRLIAGPSGQIVDGSIRFRTKAGQVYDIARMPLSDMQKIRGREIAMIFQEPMTSLNPVFTVGYQLDEVALLHIEGITKLEARERSIKMLTQVGIADPAGVYGKYPHELSGGMRQRVMIAMALICSPRLIVADEPTTALDVTIQAQILDLLKQIKEEQHSSIMLITHDLGVVAEMADYVVVMYAGKIIEMGTTEDIFDRPLHPYTIGLQKSKPSVNNDVEELYCIPGFVPNPINMPDYCYFRDRCDRCRHECAGKYPQLVSVTDTHKVACYLYADRDGESCPDGGTSTERSQA